MATRGGGAVPGSGARGVPVVRGGAGVDEGGFCSLGTEAASSGGEVLCSGAQGAPVAKGVDGVAGDRHRGTGDRSEGGRRGSPADGTRGRGGERHGGDVARRRTEGEGEGAGAGGMEGVEGSGGDRREGLGGGNRGVLGRAARPWVVEGGLCSLEGALGKDAGGGGWGGAAECRGGDEAVLRGADKADREKAEACSGGETEGAPHQRHRGDVDREGHSQRGVQGVEGGSVGGHRGHEGASPEVWVQGEAYIESRDGDRGRDRTVEGGAGRGGRSYSAAGMGGGEGRHPGRRGARDRSRSGGWSDGGVEGAKGRRGSGERSRRHSRQRAGRGREGSRRHSRQRAGGGGGVEHGGGGCRSGVRRQGRSAEGAAADSGGDHSYRAEGGGRGHRRAGARWIRPLEGREGSEVSGRRAQGDVVRGDKAVVAGRQRSLDQDLGREAKSSQGGAGAKGQGSSSDSCEGGGDSRDTEEQGG